MNFSSFDKELLRLRYAMQLNKHLLRRSRLKVQNLDASIQSAERILSRAHWRLLAQREIPAPA
jgi:hypothetical protein